MAEADAKAFAVFAVLERGESKRSLMRDLKVGVLALNKMLADVELRGRWEAHKHAIEEAEKRAKRLAVIDAVLATGNISAAAREHGISRVTVYKYLKLEGVFETLTEVIEQQRMLCEFVQRHHALEVMPAMSELACDPEAGGNSRAIAADVVRKFGERSGVSVSVANAPGGVAIAGRDGKSSLTVLPPSPAEQDLSPQRAHALARLLIESEDGGGGPVAVGGGDNDG